jgi:hypothetical protein
MAGPAARGLSSVAIGAGTEGAPTFRRFAGLATAQTVTVPLLYWLVSATPLSLLALLGEVSWVVFRLGVKPPTMLGERFDGLHDAMDDPPSASAPSPRCSTSRSIEISWRS